jgi:hypothetical protein
VRNEVSPFATFEVTHKQYRPWLDFDDGKDVLFASVHLFSNGPIHCEGSDSNAENSVDAE